MSFQVPAEAYDAFMGRFSIPLADPFIEFAGLEPAGHRCVLDVGCGPGAVLSALTGVTSRVVGIDPSASFVAAARQRFPSAELHQGSAEDLPFPDHAFDAALAQLVVHFMTDPVAGLTEMARVTKPGGLLAACVWDLAGDTGPLAPFWIAARALTPGVNDESGLPGARQGHLIELAHAAAWNQVAGGSIKITIPFDTFDGWWQPFTLGVGPAGSHVATLPATEVERLRQLCLENLGGGPFTVRARAWAVRGFA